jgi:hypothetical protein
MVLVGAFTTTATTFAAERDQPVLAISEHGPDELLETFRDVGRIGCAYRELCTCCVD